MKKILIVDDEEVLRMLIADTLEDLGFSIEEAEDGEEAWEVIQKNSYDLIILDYMMPGMTGVEVLKKLKESTVKKDIPVLMLTARSQQKDKEELLAVGADYFMEKPFRPMKLQELVEEIFHV
ncbi:response regulator transcription factor [Evansella tamaricis]|uniref:Response regulator n=1 Tax=Evansella tamaricis TaxID=2069301 RepID=A0ABS6JFQ6_9BACI|nr:response regulator [Evansella tamaricis]MBU9711158.1 response regulator [Evansella tamaricis]